MEGLPAHLRGGSSEGDALKAKGAQQRQDPLLSRDARAGFLLPNSSQPILKRLPVRAGIRPAGRDFIRESNTARQPKGSGQLAFSS